MPWPRSETLVRRSTSVPEPVRSRRGRQPGVHEWVSVRAGGHFRAARVEVVEWVVRRYGGEILTDVPAAWAGVADTGRMR